MKRIVKISSLLLVLFVMTTTAMAQKFGYVNSTAILAELPDVKQADANLEALQKQLQKKGQGMVQQLQKDYQAIQERVARGELSPKEQEDEAKALETRQAEIGKFEQDMVQQVQEKRNTLLEPIYKKVNDAIQAVAKENGFTMIFDQAILLYADDAQDVSTQVRAKLGL